LRAITFRGIATRFLIAFALVCLTWNPTRYNYYDWAVAQWSAITPIVVFVGIVLLIAWVVFLRATARSLGAFGIILGSALAGTVLWILFFYGLVDRASGDVLGWIVLALFAAVLAAGMSWSHLRRGWAGQADVDDVDEN
jgi:O-antigen/teichoic acid export membrane protein